MRCVKLVRPSLFVIENVADFLQALRVDSSSARGLPLGLRTRSWSPIGSRLRRPTKKAAGNNHWEPSGESLFPTRTHQESESLFALPTWRTVRDAIGDLPLQPTSTNRHDPRNVNQLSIERYKAIPPGGNRRDLPDHLNLKCWKFKNPKSGGSADLMGRLRWDSPSLTIRTEFLKLEKGALSSPASPSFHNGSRGREASNISGYFQICR